jgi:hypothetical protein
MSAVEPAGAARLYVRSSGALMVAFAPLLQRSRVLGLVAEVLPPSHCLHPMEHPLLNQKHDCPTSQAVAPPLDVPFTQLQPKSSGPNFPSPWLPPLHGESERSTALREGGTSSDEWARAAGAAESAAASRAAAWSLGTMGVSVRCSSRSATHIHEVVNA